MISLTNKLKSLNFDIFGSFRKSSSSGPSQDISILPANTSETVDSSTVTTVEKADTMSAEQFAVAVGLKIESFTDIDHELSILSIIASKDLDSAPVSSTRSGNTTVNYYSHSFPKLDMNMFIPPPGQNTTYTCLPELQLQNHRRASDASYFNPNRPHHGIASTPDLNNTDNEADIFQTRKKGRFTMKVERSAHWTAKSASQRKRTSSRFSLQAQKCDSSSTLLDGSVKLERVDTTESAPSIIISPALSSPSCGSPYIDRHQQVPGALAKETGDDDRRDSGVADDF